MLVYQEKKYKVVIVFWMLLHVNMITAAALRHADFPQFRQLHYKKAPVMAKLQNFGGFAVQTMN